MTLSAVAVPSYSAVGAIMNGGSTLIPNGTNIITAVNSGLAIDGPDFSTIDGEDMEIYTVKRLPFTSVPITQPSQAGPHEFGGLQRIPCSPNRGVW